MSISAASLRRLPQYMKLLAQLESEGLRFATSAELARRLKLDETLVRKDVAMTGFTGKPRVGFEVESLRAHLANFLGLHQPKEAILIGVGRLGQALAAYRGFGKYGLRIVAAFDTDPAKIGQPIGELTVQPLWQAPAMVLETRMQIAILAVPAMEAQPVADVLADAGIRAFWNFSGQPLSLPPTIIVHDEDLAESLAILSHRLSLPEASVPTLAVVGEEW